MTTQSPQKTYLGLKYKIILEQPERKFALSDSWNNLFIMNSDEKEILEYGLVGKPLIEFWHEEIGNYSESVSAVFVSADNVELPTFCQIKIRFYSQTITKTYRLAKINRIEV